MNDLGLGGLRSYVTSKKFKIKVKIDFVNKFSLEFLKFLPIFEVYNLIISTHYNLQIHRLPSRNLRISPLKQDMTQNPRKNINQNAI